ncbi:MAG: DUF262 domain-containing protein [Planctomycetes bacterium]|nr:DUF262 domain-containing protein [Planctomycetota bacterium]
MKTPKHSLRKIVSFLNNADEDGGFWLPNIQRPFVWSEDQICRLFDSILRQYPISTLLIWKTTSGIRRRKFIDNWHEGIKLSDFYVPEDRKKKCLVLDGQQRLQSLFIGLKGSFDGKELYFDILSGEVAAPDDVKYRFAFLDKAVFPWIKFKDLAMGDENATVARRRIISEAGKELLASEEEKIDEHVSLIHQTFRGDDGISYQELDSIENSALYSEDDVVEVFIRANSGGTRLGKSDLLFSLLTSTWDEADERMEDLLEDLNRTGFKYSRDFVLKSCLTILDKGARYEVEKFRTPDVRQKIQEQWSEITASIRDVADFVAGKTYIRSDKAMTSYLALIPLIYVRYHVPDAWRKAEDPEGYLLRSLLTGAYTGIPDQLIDDLVKVLAKSQAFNLKEVFGVIRGKGKSLELTEDRLWAITYGDENIHLLFNLMYREFNYLPAFKGNAPEVDHIFPRDTLKNVKVRSADSGRSVMKYPKAIQDQLANCMLLTKDENGAGGKGDTPPHVWLADKDADYFEMHKIPTDKDLWKVDRFEDFIDARKKLLKKEFSYLLAKAAKA